MMLVHQKSNCIKNAAGLQLAKETIPWLKFINNESSYVLPLSLVFSSYEPVHCLSSFFFFVKIHIKKNG